MVNGIPKSKMLACQGVANLKDTASLIALLRKNNLFPKKHYTTRSMVFTFHDNLTRAIPKNNNKLKSFDFISV